MVRVLCEACGRGAATVCLVGAQEVSLCARCEEERAAGGRLVNGAAQRGVGSGVGGGAGFGGRNDVRRVPLEGCAATGQKLLCEACKVTTEGQWRGGYRSAKYIGGTDVYFAVLWNFEVQGMRIRRRRAKRHLSSSSETSFEILGLYSVRLRR